MANCQLDSTDNGAHVVMIVPNYFGWSTNLILYIRCHLAKKVWLYPSIPILLKPQEALCCPHNWHNKCSFKYLWYRWWQRWPEHSFRSILWLSKPVHSTYPHHSPRIDRFDGVDPTLLICLELVKWQLQNMNTLNQHRGMCYNLLDYSLHHCSTK